ncbi:hypothetical protein ACFSJU_09265 [Paradesertivirga mongoliensis]|uniref:Uncharacterized protein n=1 Tax=Paradesertivirga mongoliensis TaxID=2100740 RepID=A0ABW4ZKM2_9SPHI|nr:hypothetical protein [Pedobacter mongoliensis]
MKASLFLFSSLLLHSVCWGQNISGKWYGKIIQGPGELCQICNFELELSHRKKISGESYTFIKDTSDIRIGLFGFLLGDSIKLEESENYIYRSKRPPGWDICIKSFTLKYHKVGQDEFLLGRGTGVTLDDSVCIPAQIVLSKTKTALNAYLHDPSAVQLAINSPPNLSVLPNFTPVFLNTSLKTVKEIEVRNRSLELRINDYMNVDNDTVSIYFNRDIVANKQRISKKQVRLNINLDSRLELNEIILFAENLGRIPPNTSQLLIVDGANTHRLMIESDKQKSAAIYLKYKP